MSNEYYMHEIKNRIADYYERIEWIKKKTRPNDLYQLGRIRVYEEEIDYYQRLVGDK